MLKMPAHKTSPQETKPKGYRGRFAPSPTGRLHIGSLIGALASYLDAKANNGEWLVRMEDLDPPREMPGAATQILEDLQIHGLKWDSDILYQSHRHQAYQTAIDQLLIEYKAFACSCSRTQLRSNQNIHQGRCNGPKSPEADYAIRLLVDQHSIAFTDPIQGIYEQQLQQQVGDFVLLRKDRFFAYQLAVVIDDAFQQITHVVRGSDLLDSTPRQIFLQKQLGLATPQYCHFPVITNSEHQKLSKQTFAPALSNQQALTNLQQALHFLQQPVASPAAAKSIPSLLAWATEHWSIEKIPKKLALMATENTPY
jgi:glutamyl-Q tRNA(Asp) synthetase